MSCRLAALFLVLALAGSVHAQDAKELPPPSKDPILPDPKLMADTWMATISPGPEHKMLSPLVGDWVTISKVYFEGPQSEGIGRRLKSRERAHIPWEETSHSLRCFGQLAR
jgi:hypothetical protein